MARERTAQDGILNKISLFTSLTSEEHQQVREKVVIKSFKKNEVILHEEDTNEYMYIILDGEVKVVNTTEKGKKILLTIHRSGDFFGELSLIDGKTAPAAVIAARDSVTAIISKKDFHSLLFSQSKVLENLLHILCSRFRESLKKIQMLNFNNGAQRIKIFFLMLSETHGETTNEGTILNIKLRHQDIAGMTGLTRETVTRILDKLQRGGEIRILKNRFILLCPEFESITF
jgi:CRP/FNR family transcriptional regulator